MSFHNNFLYYVEKHEKVLFAQALVTIKTWP